MLRRADLVEVFGKHGIALASRDQVAPHRFPDAVRRTLTEVGVPMYCRSAVYAGLVEDPFATYAAWCADHGAPCSAAAGRTLRIGYWRAGSVCLVPDDGRVLYISPYETDEITPMNSSVEQFGACMLIAHRDAQKCDFLPTRAALAERERIVQRLLAVDPDAVGPPHSVWRIIVDEVTGEEYRP
ncbi:SUKH-4 family immunity protein [Yinghuangia soli]|uniref:SUKH-4 family immunity protein n=1 Tax=Yinghuangia soli TaxID=2908204 RepID=A0AA41U152_9ACTN|nr:SUKH-4 family immunity protein [Yinghuangia soli]MCF2527147.1 SUKH-4 family immunity protein [Yinghuangia soli]